MAYYPLRLFLFLIVALFCCGYFNTVFAQDNRWIDLDENENYTARHECSFVQAGNSFIMFGGREQAQQLDVYDYKTNTWSLGGSAPKEFNHFQATFYEGFVWVIGSFKTNTFPNEIPADYIWLYFPPTKTWIKGPVIPENRRRGGAGLALHNDKFYLVGGNTKGHNGGYVNWFDVYDPITNTWTVLDNAPNARDHFSCIVAEDKLYALGGRHSGGEGGIFKPLIAPVDVYDFNTNSWANLNHPLPTPRAAPCVALFNNELFVIGGEGENKGPAYKLVEAYNLKTETWSQKADMHYPRHGTQAIVSGKSIYVAGGSPTRGGGRQLNMEVYNTNQPKGYKLKASKLHTPKKVHVAPNKSTFVRIANQKGNTGVFINSISITGQHKDSFILKESYNNLLLKSGETLEIAVKNLETATTKQAEIIITFNGFEKKTIMLLSN
ncbi:Kelch repeat-containing protein [Jejuia pallidilutea]|uniref:Ring canal kelch-like protein n=1 Tax=Jejuia pallidilutea TaxID=504487 RepID=A0A098LTX7_9FLAO|nr:kelch repeat-containing protein [Jejuia pallidilutea]GAL90366.1 ring canal kelch-like protein [Jejuia pallidilutea]